MEELMPIDETSLLIELDEEKIKNLKNESETLLKDYNENKHTIESNKLEKIIESLSSYKSELELHNERIIRSKKKIEVTRKYLLELFKNSPVGYVTLDQNGIVHEANYFAERYLNTFAGVLIGQKLNIFLMNEYRTKFTYLIEKVFKTRARSVMEVKGAFANDKDRWLHISVSYIKPEFESEPRALCVLVDITDAKTYETDLVVTKSVLEQRIRQKSDDIEKAYFELKAANKQLIDQHQRIIEEERLKVILQMAGATVHEINQPLMKLLSNIEMMEIKKEDPKEFHEIMEKINVSGKKISNIINKIQTLQESEPLRSVPVSSSIKILLMDISDKNFELIREFFKNEDQIHLIRCKSIADSYKMIETYGINVILMTYSLPDGNSMDFLKQLLKKEIDIPVIVLSEYHNEVIISDLLRAGAYDCLSKNMIDKDNIIRSVINSYERFSLKKEMGVAMKKMAEMSTRDELTGLYNRRFMNEVLNHEFSRAKRYGTDLSCLLIDLDFFKNINDSFGHIFGDFVLKEFAQTIIKFVRESDSPFRYGGEEFLILLPNTSLEGAKSTADKIRKHFESKIYEDENSKATVTISIGVCSLQAHNPKEPKDMLSYTDKALYGAKAEGRNRVKVFLDKSNEESSEEKEGKVLKYFKDKLLAVLEKTKQASISSLELMVRDMGIERVAEHKKMLRYIEHVGIKLNLPGTVIESIKRATSLHHCFNNLLKETLLKETELTENERAKIKDHPYMMSDLIGLFDFFSNERSILLYHHEKFDGSGYPEKLKGSEIPFGARIFAIAEALSSMISDRPYRKKLSLPEIISELTKNAGTQFDPMLVNFFIKVAEELNKFE
ncbi:MAG: diguanylate cyclase [Desulfobacterales bacterium]|nr:diguanylate cyclase [Desulfobacterales bacterium]